jgi:hypothetical protein
MARRTTANCLNGCAPRSTRTRFHVLLAAQREGNQTERDMADWMARLTGA